MESVNNFSELPGAGDSDVGKGQSFQSLAAGQLQPQTDNMTFNAEHVVLTNMTNVTPWIVVSDKQFQDKLENYSIGARQREYEAPHITIRSPDDKIARIRIRDSSLMEPSEVDADVIKAVQADIANRLDDYIRNWNDNNPDHAIPLQEEQQNEQPKKDESWKEAAWYKEVQRLQALEEENTGEESSA